MRILLADEGANTRYGLRVLFEERPGLEVIGEAADARDLMAQVAADCPDLVLLSWGLPGLGRSELLAALQQLCDDVRVIVLSGRPEERQAVLDAGADAFISKVEPPERLLAAIAALVQVDREGDMKRRRI